MFERISRWSDEIRQGWKHLGDENGERRKSFIYEYIHNTFMRLIFGRYIETYSLNEEHNQQ